MNPGQRGHIRGLARAVHANYSAVWKELRNLEAAGLVVSEEEGGSRFFRLNPQYPLVDEGTNRIGAAEAEHAISPARSWFHTRRRVSEAVSLNGQPATLSRNRCRSEWVKPEST